MASSKGNTHPVMMPTMTLQWLRTRIFLGPAYLWAWLHRLSGICLLLFLWVHIYTISHLIEPQTFDAKVAWWSRLGVTYLEWLLALPVIYHALNGGRLILYEVFNNRREGLIAAWVAGLSILYSAILLIVAASNITMAPSLLLGAWLLGLVLAGIVVIATRTSQIGIPWKLQRISGAFLLLMIPVHMLFMHVNALIGHDSATIIARVQANAFIKIVDFSIVVSALYHAAYGLVSIAKDYVRSERAILYLTILISFFSLLLGWLGIKTLMVL